MSNLVPNLFNNPQTVDKDGNPTVDNEDNPAVNVTIGSSGVPQSHNRHVLVDGNDINNDVGTALWEADESVKAIRLKAVSATAPNLIRFVFDATPVDDSTDKAQAIAWLTAVAATDGADTDVEYFEHLGNVSLSEEWSDWYEFPSSLRRLDAIAVSVDEAVNIMIEVT